MDFGKMSRREILAGLAGCAAVAAIGQINHAAANETRFRTTFPLRSGNQWQYTTEHLAKGFDGEDRYGWLILARPHDPTAGWHFTQHDNTDSPTSSWTYKENTQPLRMVEEIKKIDGQWHFVCGLTEAECKDVGNHDYIYGVMQRMDAARIVNQLQHATGFASDSDVTTTTQFHAVRRRPDDVTRTTIGETTDDRYNVWYPDRNAR